MRSKPSNTARGTPWDWRTCGALAKREKRRGAYPSKRREARRRALRLDAVRCRGPWVRAFLFAHYLRKLECAPDPWRPARPRCFFRERAARRAEACRAKADGLECGLPRADQINRGGGALASALVIPGRERSERTRNPGRHGRADNCRPGFRAPAGVYHRAGPGMTLRVDQRRAHQRAITLPSPPPSPRPTAHPFRPASTPPAACRAQPARARWPQSGARI